MACLQVLLLGYAPCTPGTKCIVCLPVWDWITDQRRCTSTSRTFTEVANRGRQCSHGGYKAEACVGCKSDGGGGHVVLPSRH